MTTAPYIDKSSTKRTPDWLVTIRKGAIIQTFRFTNEADAQAFAEANQ